MTDDRNILGYTFGGLGVIFSSINPNEILQITLSILSAVSILLSITYSVYRWYKLAKKDGKITHDEVDDLGNIIKQSADKLAEYKKEHTQNGTRNTADPDARDIDNPDE